MSEQLSPIDKRPALVVKITKNTDEGFLTYGIQITHQRYRGREFSKGSCEWIASNDFTLMSDGCRETEEENSSNRDSSYGYNNMFFVRGCWGNKDNDIAIVKSVSYIEKLKVAIKEYNEYMAQE
jgi:hypothetical protein